jgi:hypothetical protein
MAKEIQLTQGKVAIVDDEDFEYLNQWKWCLRGTGRGKFYAIRGFRKSKKNNKTGSVRMHRQIMKVEKGFVVDHIDGNTLNNKKNNFRICTQSDNCKNQKMSIKNKCGYKGVSQQKNTNKFISQISLNNNKIYLGTFTDIIDAARAYNEAALKYHGEFAHINKID